MARGGHNSERGQRASSYDEGLERRFGSGSGRFGFAEGAGGLTWVFGFFAMALTLVVIRLVYVQVIAGPTYAEAAETRRTYNNTIQARRGTIFDRNGNVLAKSEECYDVYCDPREVNEPEEEAALVAEWLGGTAADYAEELSRSGETFVYLKRAADKDACESMRSDLYAKQYTGIYLINQMRRVYPYGAVGGQILGKVDVDGNGISGLELTYDEQLRGTSGTKAQELGWGGTPIADVTAQVQDAEDGKDLILSLDIDVQEFAEKTVEDAVEDGEATSGFCMITNPNTGEIIAACSTPYADLTNPELITAESLNLKMVSDAYEPGSTFKVLTAAIALETGALDTGTYLTIPPTIWVGTDLVTDIDGRYETTAMNLREILRRSSNVGAAYVAQYSIGADDFAAGLESFGIGSLTGIDFPGEVAGIVRGRQEYDGSSVGSMSFGQGLTVPMVQMVRSVGAVANGGLLKTPHFVVTLGDEDLNWGEGERAISEGTAEKVADMMQTVVEEGTGASSAVDGFDVAAKTGTGEQAEDGAYVEGKYLASVIGFAPTRDPEVLVYIGVNETPEMSYSAAGPAFSAIMGEVLQDLDVQSSSQVL